MASSTKRDGPANATPPPNYKVQRRESMHVGATHSTLCIEGTEAFETTTVDLAGLPLRIRQHSEMAFCTGCRLWDSSIALARWILAHGVPWVANKRVLEMGSGCGLAGLAATREAEHVRLTDGEARLLPNLRFNADQLAGVPVEVAHLNWSDTPDKLTAEHGTWDVVLGADLVYSSGCVAPLARAISALLKPGGALLMCSPSGRHGLEQLVTALRAAGMRCERSVLDAELLRGAACQGNEAEVRAHPFVLLRACKAV